jgi:blocked-early-in-transport protein 1
VNQSTWVGTCTAAPSSPPSHRPPPFSPRYPGAGQSFSGAAILEQQNDDALDELAAKVAMLKGVTTGIHEEVTSQNAFLDNFGGAMGKTSDLLSNVTGQISTMLRSGSNKHMCYLILFAFFIFMLVYFMIRSSLNK